MERKKENQRLLDEETATIKGKAQREAGAGGKVTRAQIEELLQNEEQEELKTNGKVEDDHQNVLVKIELKPFYELNIRMLANNDTFVML